MKHTLFAISFLGVSPMVGWCYVSDGIFYTLLSPGMSDEARRSAIPRAVGRRRTGSVRRWPCPATAMNWGDD